LADSFVTHSHSLTALRKLSLLLSVNASTVLLKHTMNSHSLPALAIGDRCYIKNQTGNYPHQWDQSGTVVESHGYNSYFKGRKCLQKKVLQFLPKSTKVSSAKSP